MLWFLIKSLLYRDKMKLVRVSFTIYIENIYGANLHRVGLG